jgi:hypothetical protein
LNLLQRSVLEDFAFGYTNNDPALLAKFAGYAAISLSIRLDLVSPERNVGTGGILALCAAMPKAPVHENRNFAAGPREIGFPWHRPVLAIAAQLGCPKQFS